MDEYQSKDIERLLAERAKLIKTGLEREQERVLRIYVPTLAVPLAALGTYRVWQRDHSPWDLIAFPVLWVGIVLLLRLFNMLVFIPMLRRRPARDHVQDLSPKPARSELTGQIMGVRLLL